MFTPLAGLAGGTLIGLGADALLLLNGDIMGASGIVNSFLHPLKVFQDVSQHWKIVFVASFLSTSAFLLGPHFDWTSAYQAGRPLSALGFALGGFLVGFGTKMGNGCTSGHGICGLGRMSRRSMAAVGTFMVTAIATAVVTAPGSMLFPAFLQGSVETEKMEAIGKYLAVGAVLAAMVAPFFHKATSRDDLTKGFSAALAGGLFSSGLYVSTMVFPAKIFDFLDVTRIFNGTWDPTLTMVLGGGLAMSLLAYQTIEEFRVVADASTFAMSDVVTNMRRSFAAMPGELRKSLSRRSIMRSVLEDSSLSSLSERDRRLSEDSTDGLTADEFTAILAAAGHRRSSGASVPRSSERRRSSLTISAPVAMSGQRRSFAAIPTNQKIDAELIVGSISFGLGWGISGICPGPAMFLAAVGVPSLLLTWWPAYYAGAYLASEIKAQNCR